MNSFRLCNLILFAFCIICTFRRIESTCVLESDFGFILNCAFKKSGLFRVRNLGGVKAHFGLGFSLGDELGLAESLGNVEGSKRRALNLRTNPNNIGVLPASKMPVTNYVSPVHQSRPQALTSKPNMLTLGSGGALIQRPIVGTPIYPKKSPAISQMTQATSLPLGVPAFRPLPRFIEVETTTSNGQSEFLKKSATVDYDFQNQIMNQTMSYVRPARLSDSSSEKKTFANLPAVPSFQAMPNSISRASLEAARESENRIEPSSKNSIMTIPPKDSSSKKQDKYEGFDLQGHTLDELALAANVSVDVIKEAIRLRQHEISAQKHYQEQKSQMLRNHVKAQRSTTTTTTTSTTTTTTTTPKPKMKYPSHSGHKVMNAPKEYYPVGYDKNFDDNFKSRVDLPPTSFNCGDQKHFPGLYGDEDLGCMVFHVCALTDDGLIMKSFLCPESTLFDQNILKCNWWFYVDCKNSKGLYDANLPVSKSYQLMKALSFFSSNYKNSQNQEGVDIEALKNSVSSNNNT